AMLIPRGGAARIRGRAGLGWSLADEGRGSLAFMQSPEQALFERSENILLSDRQRSEGFQSCV
ncbi:hypothetical protein BRC69_02880, partial [Halobacteriales archaeon QH_6_66_25]